MKFGRRFSSFFCLENRQKHFPPKLHRKFHHQTSLRGSGLWRALQNDFTTTTANWTHLYTSLKDPQIGAWPQVLWWRGVPSTTGTLPILDLVAPYRAILRYYRCDTPYRAILFEGGWRSPKMVRYPPLVLSFTKAHLCDTPFCNTSRDNCAIPHKNKHEMILRYYRYKYRAI